MKYAILVGILNLISFATLAQGQVGKFYCESGPAGAVLLDFNVDVTTKVAIGRQTNRETGNSASLKLPQLDPSRYDKLFIGMVSQYQNKIYFYSSPYLSSVKSVANLPMFRGKLISQLVNDATFKSVISVLDLGANLKGKHALTFSIGNDQKLALLCEKF